MTTNILVVDDDQQIINSLKRLFKDLPYHFEYYTDSQKGLNKVNQNEYAVIITDQEMARIKGIEILKHARKMQSNISLILMTGFSDINVVINAVNEAGIFKYVSKPWDNKEFISIVHLAVKEKQRRDMESFTFNFLKDNNILGDDSKIDQHSLKKSFIEQNLNILTKVIESKDPALFTHSLKVGEVAKAFSQYLGLSKEKQYNIYYSGLLHDIGKIAIRDQILYKSDRLTDIEFNKMKDHAIIGSEIIRQGVALENIADIVKQHHESYDGSGYPLGLKGEEILFGAQVLTIADVYVALTEKRSYKKAYGLHKIINIMSLQAGKKFNEKMINQFLVFIESRGSNEK